MVNIWEKWYNGFGNYLCALSSQVTELTQVTSLLDFYQRWKQEQEKTAGKKALSYESFSAWCPLKGHTYLSKPAAKSYCFKMHRNHRGVFRTQSSTQDGAFCKNS